MEKSELQGISSTLPYAGPSFEQRIKDRVDKKSNFSRVVFSGKVTEEILAEVKEALEVPMASASWHFNISDDPDFKKKLIRNLESEIGQPECNEPTKGVIPDSYGKEDDERYSDEDAERWIKEFREAMAKAPKTSQSE